MTASHPAPKAPPVILFDGFCRFCNGTVNFLIDRDPARRLRFAAFQSEAAGRLHPEAVSVVVGEDTLALIEDKHLYLRSTAVLRALRYLRWPWPLLSALRLVPAPLRDAVYALFARNRHRWFGTLEACRVPTPEYRERFLE